MPISAIPERCYALALLLPAALLCGCALDEQLSPAACYQPPTQLTTADLCELLPDACTPPATAPPAVSNPVTVVPSAAMPAGVVSQNAHNNLDIAWHQGRLFFAFRTGESHFADDGIYLYVVSTTDQQSWTLEASFTLGKDLREPRLLPLGDRLFLYFARLSPITLTFNPEAMMVSEQLGGCQWTEPEEIEPTGERGFIPWRARQVKSGVGHLMGYVGGDDIYDLSNEGIRVYWLQTKDGRSFEPVVPGQPLVLQGGVSETDWTILEDGTLVAVARNEAGDEEGWGSKICRAEAGSLGDWTCAHDGRKYDSPLVLRHSDDTVYLIARRQVANDGLFDLGLDELSFEEQALQYQSTYWSTPKRCSLWRIDAQALAAEHVLDLPSNGDTCFASALPLSDTQHLIYNYTSPLDDPELPWNDGQWGPTSIYRLTLTLP